MTISRWIIRRMGNVSNDNCRENQSTHFVFSDFSENRAVYKIMSKNMVEPERTPTIWRLRVAYWISKPTRSQAHARARAPKTTHPLTHTHTHTHAHRNMCYLFLSTATMVSRTRLIVTIHVHCLSCVITTFCLWEAFRRLGNTTVSPDAECLWLQDLCRG